MKHHEVNVVLRSLGDWSDWLRQNPWARDPAYVEDLVAAVARDGLHDPQKGYVAPNDVEIVGPNYRESIIAHRRNARLRALLEALLAEQRRGGRVWDVYAPEQVTAFAKTARNRFRNFVGSEYLPSAEERARHPKLDHQDVMALTYPDESFDLYFSCEVMEHIPDVEVALREACRVLRPGAALISMFPFAYGSQASIVRSRIVDGRLVELLPAEFHGNPVDPESGSRVFTVPGWEIIDWAKAAGFADAHFIARSSRYFGITGAEIATLMIFVARKAD